MLRWLAVVPLFNFMKKTYKLHIHVVEVVMEIAFDLIAIVNISDGKTHPIGAIISR